ncbi:PAS domain S-box protein [Longispora albida]|uniref:PAS domain S-box protein n=1 Tax=Longispora albida TaxID=203523 RepID=UPI00036C8973|nr:PAS domain S-box protein [Longispora albida]
MNSAAPHGTEPLGAWTWELASSHVRWSRQLGAIYGLPPGLLSGEPAFFLGRVHPADQAVVEKTIALVRHDGEPLRFDHRVVRPDGAIRWVRQHCGVVGDAEGSPAQLVGTCVDVTATKPIEDVLKDSEERFQMLLASVPDAVVGIDADGVIVLANERTTELFGYSEVELVGQPVELLVPERFRASHTRSCDGYLAAPQLRPMGAGLELSARRRDGTEFPVEIALSPLRPGPEGKAARLVLAAVRDVTEQRQARKAAAELREAQLRRRQALEINDNLLQHLVAAAYALERGDVSESERALSRTISAAREIMRNLLGGGEIAPGDLVRDTPAPALRPQQPPVPGGSVAASTVRVLVADDSADIRLALRAVIGSIPGVAVVAEAADGAEAVFQTANLRPDLVLLDLAMPVMDGLQALAEIQRLCSGTRVVVLTGYGREKAAQQAMRGGAVAFLEKGGSTRRLPTLIQDLFPGLPGGTAVAVSPPAANGVLHDWAGPQRDLVTHYAHELRNPVMAVEGIAFALSANLDQLPSPATRELLSAMVRNLRHINRLLDTLVAAGRLETDELELIMERLDLSDLVRDVVAEMAELTSGHPVTVNAPGQLLAGVDSLRIRQVLTNLLSNAAKFSPAGAPIGISLARNHEAGTAEITVTDWGEGIPEHNRSRLFGKFEQLGRRTTGLGLGLYLSRAIARAHGGTLELAASGPGGSVFTLSLPALTLLEE